MEAKIILLLVLLIFPSVVTAYNSSLINVSDDITWDEFADRWTDTAVKTINEEHATTADVVGKYITIAIISGLLFTIAWIGWRMLR